VRGTANHAIIVREKDIRCPRWSIYRSTARFYLPAYIFFVESWFLSPPTLPLPRSMHTRATLRRGNGFLPLPSSFFFFFFLSLFLKRATTVAGWRDSRESSTIAPFVRTFIFLRDENRPLFITTRRVM